MNCSFELKPVELVHKFDKVQLTDSLEETRKTQIWSIIEIKQWVIGPYQLLQVLVACVHWH